MFLYLISGILLILMAIVLQIVVVVQFFIDSWFNAIVFALVVETLLIPLMRVAYTCIKTYQRIKNGPEAEIIEMPEEDSSKIISITKRRIG